MFRATGMDQHGRVYHVNGIKEKYKKNLETAIEDFEHLDQAEEYAASFIKVYPQVRFSISENEVEVKVVQDEEYWSWHHKHTQEWNDVMSKGRNLQKYIVFGFLTVVGILLAVFTHLTAELSLLLKLVSFPVISIIGWLLVERLFSKAF